MSRMLDALEENPSRVFEIRAELPSGNILKGTIGPVVNGNALVEIWFTSQPASPDDLGLADEILNNLMGGPATAEYRIDSAESRERALAAIRRSMGGGMG